MNRALVVTMGFGGLRIGEAVALHVADFEALRGRLNVSKAYSEVSGRLIAGTTKGKRARKVKVPSVVVEAIAAHLAENPAPRMLSCSLRPAVARFGGRPGGGGSGFLPAKGGHR